MACALVGIKTRRIMHIRLSSVKSKWRSPTRESSHAEAEDRVSIVAVASLR